MSLRMINRNVKIFYISDALYYGSYDILNTFLGILITYKVTDGRLDAVGLVIGYYMLVRALFVVPLSRISAHYSDRKKIRVMTIGAIVYGGAIASLGIAPSLLVVFGIQTVTALLDAYLYPIKWSVFTDILDKGNVGTEWSVNDALSTGATALFSIIGGVISQQFGLTALFLFMGSTFAISGLVFGRMMLSRGKFSRPLPDN